MQKVITIYSVGSLTGSESVINEHEELEAYFSEGYKVKQVICSFADESFANFTLLLEKDS